MRPQRGNATCGSNERRRAPEGQSQAGPGERAAARRGSPPVPRRRAAPAGTRRRGRASGYPQASGSLCTSRSRRAPRSTVTAHPGQPKRRCPPAPGSAGSEGASRRVPASGRCPSREELGPHGPFIERETPPCVRPFSFGSRPPPCLPLGSAPSVLAQQQRPSLRAGASEGGQGRREGRRLSRGQNLARGPGAFNEPLSGPPPTRPLSPQPATGPPPLRLPFENLLLIHQALTLQLL